MIKLKELFSKLRGGKPAPVIPTMWGEPVTESARLQCAMNMLGDPEVKARVEEVLIRQYGHEHGLRLARQRYPEAYVGVAQS